MSEEDVLNLKMEFITTSLNEIKEQLKHLLESKQKSEDELYDEINDLKTAFTEYKHHVKETYMPKNAPNKFRESIMGWGLFVIMLFTLGTNLFNLLAKR